MAAAVTGGLALGFAGAGVALAVAASAVLVLALAPAQGWLQGELRFGGLRRPLRARGRGPAGVQRGHGGRWARAGRGADRVRGRVAPFVLAAGPSRCSRPRVAARVLAQRARWAETGDIALVQFVLSVLVGADVLAAASPCGTVAEAGFQALATLAKGPVYVAAGTVLVAFPLLRASAPAAAEALRGAC